MDLESLFRKVGGPVGVRAGFCIGGGLVDVDWGDAGRCFIVEGDGGRALEFGLEEEIEMSGRSILFHLKNVLEKSIDLLGCCRGGGSLRGWIWDWGWRTIANQ